MSNVQAVEEAIAKLAPEEIREVADWLENFLEDQRELRPEFRESIERGQADLAAGRVRVVTP
jgi:hypothetical protein